MVRNRLSGIGAMGLTHVSKKQSQVVIDFGGRSDGRARVSSTRALFNGNGSTPFSSGLATRSEFFAAVARKDVTTALQQELKALCEARAPKASWVWAEPPLTEEQVVPLQLPALEEADLLTNPVDELKRVEELLQDQPTP